VTDFLPFPEKEIAIGDTWDVTLPTSIPLGGTKITLPAKLAGEETYEGVNAWVVTVEKKGVATENKVKIRMGDITKEGKITGKANISIRALIEKGTGRTLSVTSKVQSDQEMSIEDGIAPTPSSIEYTSTMSLKVAKA
jgi:hypothetical protein